MNINIHSSFLRDVKMLSVKVLNRTLKRLNLFFFVLWNLRISFNRKSVEADAVHIFRFDHGCDLR